MSNFWGPKSPSSGQQDWTLCWLAKLFICIYYSVISQPIIPCDLSFQRESCWLCCCVMVGWLAHQGLNLTLWSACLLCSPVLSWGSGLWKCGMVLTIKRLANYFQYSVRQPFSIFLFCPYIYRNPLFIAGVTFGTILDRWNMQSSSTFVLFCVCFYIYKPYLHC